MTLDLVIIVMLNSAESETYIESIMSLSEEAQDDVQKLIMRSKTNLTDLISSAQSQSEHPFTVDDRMSNMYLTSHRDAEELAQNALEDHLSDGRIDPNLLEDMANQSEALSSNMLLDHNEDQQKYVQEQIKKLDTLFDNQGLGGLNTEREGMQRAFDQKKDFLMNKVLELEQDNSRLDDKSKEQTRINQELADKIQ